MGMFGGTIASLFVRVGADTKPFKQGMKGAEGTLKRSAGKMNREARALKRSMAVNFMAAAAGVYVLQRALKGVLTAFETQEMAETKINAALRSTRHAAGMAADELFNMAKQLQTVTLYGDETVLSAEALLLSFTKIGRDIFPQALETVLDMSTALGQDLKSSAIQVGKALQDPILGVTALRRVGVNFNEAQTEVIRNLVRTGRAAEAQRLILKELNTEFGGQARAAAGTYSGALKQMGNEMGDLREIIGEQLAPSFARLATEMGPVLDTFADMLGFLNEIEDFKKKNDWLLGDVTGYQRIKSEKLSEFEEGQNLEIFMGKVAAQAAAIAKQTGVAVGNLSDFAAAANIIHQRNILEGQAESARQLAASIKDAAGYWKELLQGQGSPDMKIQHQIDMLNALKYGIAGYDTSGAWDVPYASQENVERARAERLGSYAEQFHRDIMMIDPDSLAQLEKVPELILSSTNEMTKFHEASLLAADVISHDLVNAIFEMGQAGESMLTSLLNMVQRLARELASMWLMESIMKWLNPVASVAGAILAPVTGTLGVEAALPALAPALDMSAFNSALPAAATISNPTVNIIDKRTAADPPVTVSTSGDTIDIILESAIKGQLTSGVLDDTMRNVYGVSRNVVVR